MAPIDPSILAEFDVRGEATFWVMFQEKANLAPAFEIQDWGERGQFVYDRLVETAETSQAGVRALLGEWGAEVTPFWISNVINNSWGESGAVSVYQNSVRAWVAAGIFPVFSNGNEGPACNTTRAPASYPESYGVGAHDSGDIIADFSSRGPSIFDPFPIKPDITAPGVDLRTSYPDPPYVRTSGTSGSSSLVAGTVALMWSLNPELIGQIHTSRLHLDHTAIDTSDLTCGGEPWDNNVWGEGRLDAFEAVSLVFFDGFESADTSAWSAVKVKVPERCQAP